MTTPDEKLALDNEGIPILTEAIPPTVFDAQPGRTEGLGGLTPDDIAEQLLESEDFQQQIDEIAAKLTVSMRTQISETITPAIEEAIQEAITRALNISGDNTFSRVRQQLESMLPELVTRTLKRTAEGD